MLDFCYFANLSMALQTIVWPDNLIWFHANYVICMGTLFLAAVLWQTPLAFNSLLRFTGFIMHVSPALILHSIRYVLNILHLNL